MFSGHLAFLHVRPDVHHEVASLGAGDFGLGGRMSAAMAEMEQDADAQEACGRGGVAAFCDREGVPVVEASGGPGVSAEWLTELGSQPAWLAAHGRAADLIVMGRRAEGRSVALDVLETVLMETGTPGPDRL